MIRAMRNPSALRGKATEVIAVRTARAAAIALARPGAAIKPPVVVTPERRRKQKTEKILTSFSRHCRAQASHRVRTPAAADAVEMVAVGGLVAHHLARGSRHPAATVRGNNHPDAGMTGLTEMTGVIERFPGQAPISRTR